MEELRLGVVRGITYGHFAPPEKFVPAARELGAGAVRAYLYWQQVEPEPGRFTWDTVDSLLAQLDGEEEAWVTVCSSSLWATEKATDFLPPSPARDLDAYKAFVRELVAHCAGRVKYWQCDNEPSVPILWAGTREQYAAQLAAFASAVREADSAATIVLAGMPPNDEHGVFAYLAEHSRDHFDVFDIHLYGDAYRIPERIEECRALMAAHGYQKPVVAGEYSGPVPFQIPEVFPYLGHVMEEVMKPANAEQGYSSSDLGRKAPEHDAMVALYERMAELPTEVQMFMEGCPPEAERLRHRWNARDIVIRNLLALSAGIRLTLCWNLAPEMPRVSIPYQVMTFMFDKLKLMDYDGDALGRRYPSGEALALTNRMLRGAGEVVRREVPGSPELYVFEVDRGSRPPLVVAWERRDELTGEDLPPTPFEWPWPHPAVAAVNAHGEAVSARVAGGRVLVDLTSAPVFLEA
ncbi:glycoside hydrolase family 44 protein [Nonomuraea sediminis]|uniref:glycoside hydrolase family 44 protein n=1 Tax=Nonomuraea sediminis TaxID=2835864 RepID=UPI001BDDBC2B|nr:glycoside hydrolase family 44 protein [Nonomuraea sediminis]